MLMSATGDHNLVRERIPHCRQLVMKGVMHKVKRRFLEHPLDRSANLLNQMAQIVITYHNEKVGRPLIDETCHSKGVNVSNKIVAFLPGLAQIFQFCEILQRALDLGWTDVDSATFPWSEFHRGCGSSVLRPSSACLNWEVPNGTESEPVCSRILSEICCTPSIPGDVGSIS